MNLMEAEYQVTIDGIKWSQIPYSFKKKIALRNRVDTCIMGFSEKQIIKMESKDFLWFRKKYLSIYAELIWNSVPSLAIVVTALSS